MWSKNRELKKKMITFSTDGKISTVYDHEYRTEIFHNFPEKKKNL